VGVYEVVVCGASFNVIVLWCCGWWWKQCVEDVIGTS